MADVVDLAARRPDHRPSPRAGEGVYRHGVLKGYAGTYRPMPHEYPLTCICKGCGKTIQRLTAEGKWGHVEW